MARDPLLVGLVALVCGSVVWLLAPLWRSRASGPAWQRERSAWRTVIAPLIVVALGTALLVGWALEEPAESDERLTPLAWAFVAVVSLLWGRAVVRFVRSTTATAAAPISVVGLLRPRIVVDPRLEAVLDADAVSAACAHESAHARHRDPLRIALAQLATDLQWPWPAARQRLQRWRAALEEARDDEAVALGAAPDDLAHAIVEAAKLVAIGGGAALTGDRVIAARVSRLLDGTAGALAPRSCGFAALVLVALALSFVVGIQLGDDIVGLLPGVLR